MSWTDERVETLKKLWAEGHSASQIAAEVGWTRQVPVLSRAAPAQTACRFTHDARPADVDARQYGAGARL